MPIYDPAIHDAVRISLPENNFVQAYTDIDSPTFGNAYQSAIKAGYSHSYARVILHYFPKWRIKKARKNIQNPMAQFLAKDVQASRFIEVTPSGRELKRRRGEENRKSKAILDEVALYFGEPE